MVKFGERKRLVKLYNEKTDNNSIESWKNNLKKPWLHLDQKEYFYNQGLVLMDNKLKEGGLAEARDIYYDMRKILDHGNNNGFSKEKIEKYQEALAKRGYRLVKKLQKENYHDSANEEMLVYSRQHLSNKPTGLEKTITVISLGSILLGVAIGYPVVTGNIIGEDVRYSILSGLALFLLGLIGVFFANRK